MIPSCICKLISGSFLRMAGVGPCTSWPSSRPFPASFSLFQTPFHNSHIIRTFDVPVLAPQSSTYHTHHYKLGVSLVRMSYNANSIDEIAKQIRAEAKEPNERTESLVLRQIDHQTRVQEFHKYAANVAAAQMRNATTAKSLLDTQNKDTWPRLRLLLLRRSSKSARLPSPSKRPACATSSRRATR